MRALLPTSSLNFKFFSIQEIEINLDFVLPVGHDIADDPKARVNLGSVVHEKRRSIYHDQSGGQIPYDPLVIKSLEECDIVSGIPGLRGTFDQGGGHKEYLKQISAESWLQRCEWTLEDKNAFRRATKASREKAGRNSFRNSTELKQLLRICYVRWHKFLFRALNKPYHSSSKNLRVIAERLIEQFMPYRSLTVSRMLLDEGSLSIRAKELVRSGSQIRAALKVGLLRKQGRQHFVINWDFVEMHANAIAQPRPSTNSTLAETRGYLV